MWKNLVSKVWRKIPSSLRLKLTRSTQKKFTVSVVAIVLNEEGNVLLLDHVLRPKFSWGLPGGFIEEDEQPTEAVKREIREETSLELEEIKLLRVRTINRHIEILFRARASGKGEVSSLEIKQIAWFGIDALPRQMSKIQKQIIKQVLSKQGDK